MKPSTAISSIWKFYAEGFRSMTVGRKLWALIIIKLAIFFLVFRLFFFPDVLSRDYSTDEQRAEAVRNNLLFKSRKLNLNLLHYD